jgi:hypothetical protein
MRCRRIGPMTGVAVRGTSAGTRASEYVAGGQAIDWTGDRTSLARRVEALSVGRGVRGICEGRDGRCDKWGDEIVWNPGCAAATRQTVQSGDRLDTTSVGTPAVHGARDERCAASSR